MAHDFVQLPPDGAGKKLHTEVHADGTHNQVMTLGDPRVADQLQYVDKYGAAFVRFSEGNQIFDSFGKSKMSQETLVGQYMPRYDTLPKLIQTELTGAGVETYLPNTSSIKLQVGTAAGDKVRRTTNKYHKYYPGTSQLAEFTITLGDTGKANVVRQWGYYDDENGIIFRVNGTSFEFVLRSSITGTPVETVITQPNFNVDKGDGTGVSGLLMNPSFANIYWCDLQYLGVGRVRVGAYAPNGSRVVFHEIQNANNQPNVYMTTGSLPLRWEQYNLDISASTSEMTIHNAAVYTEAATLDVHGLCYSTAAWGALPTPKTSLGDGTFCSMVSVRPKSIFRGKTNRTNIIPQYLLFNCTTACQVSIYRNVDNGAQTWMSVHDDSVAEKSGDGTFVSLNDGHSVFCTMAPVGTSRIDIQSSFSYFDEHLAINADGTQPTYTIIFRAMDGSATTAGGGISWKELII